MSDIFTREIKGTFYSWKGAAWIVACSVVFSCVSYLLLTDKELSLLDQGEMLFMLTEVIIVLGLILSTVTASTILSGEREAGTLETLLLTPVSPLRIAAEKVFSVFALWLILFTVSLPYIIVVASGTGLTAPAIFYTGLYGSVLVLGISLVSVTISAIANSKTSLLSSLTLVLVLLAPALFFATSLKNNSFGIAIERINPVSQAFNSLDNVLVDNTTAFIHQISYLPALIVFLIVCAGIFFRYCHSLEFTGGAE